MFAIGCCRGIWDKFTSQEDRTFVELAESDADGLVPKSAWQRASEDVLRTRVPTHNYDLATLIVYALASEDLVLCALRCSEFTAFLSVMPSIDEASLNSLDSSGLEAVQARTRQHATLLRCVAGERYRLPKAKSAWLTTDVLALARGIYDDRAFDRMPILADALQDAGCTNEDILSHCRDTNQVHVRGCWVVDLLLGKV